jgi:CBS domain-containing protein
MKVREIMVEDVQCCGPHTNLAEATKMMWDRDCGSLPVVNTESRVVGIITDRDICMSVATKNRQPSDITVWETISEKLSSCVPDACMPDDDARDALRTMAAQKIRRLPVIDAHGLLQGILSMNDLILHAEEAGKRSNLSYEDVMHTLKAISTHRVPMGASTVPGEPS